MIAALRCTGLIYRRFGCAILISVKVSATFAKFFSTSFAVKASGRRPGPCRQEPVRGNRKRVFLIRGEGEGRLVIDTQST